MTSRKNRKKSNIVTTKYLGTFRVKSGALVVSDPCYHSGENLLKGVLNGTWNAWTEHKPDAWSTRGHEAHRRVSALIAIHSNYKARGRIRTCDSGVDSGQCGIFDESFYPTRKRDFEQENDTFYGKCCNGTYSEEECLPSWPLSGEALLCYEALSAANNMTDTFIVESINRLYGTTIFEAKGSVIDNQGVVSAAGYGDGSYPVYVTYNSKGQVVSVRIQYF